MNNPNSVPGFLPRDESYHLFPIEPGSAILHLYEMFNKAMSIIENRYEMQRKSATRWNHAVNTGYRIYDPVTYVPTNWTLAGAGAACIIDTVRTGGRTTNYSVGIIPGAAANGTLTQSLPVFPGQRFSVSGWVKILAGASGLVKLATNGAVPAISQVAFTAAKYGIGGWIAFPSLHMGGVMVEIPTDATTLTLTLQADANTAGIEFSEFQVVHGTQAIPHLWVPAAEDTNTIVGPLSVSGNVTLGTSGGGNKHTIYGRIDPDDVEFTPAAANPATGQPLVASAIWVNSANGHLYRGAVDLEPAALPPSGAAGGDLLGSTYPNPTIAAGVVTKTKLASEPASAVDKFLSSRFY